MKILQIGKFFPIRGGVEKVMYDLTEGISQMGIPCDMLCTSEKAQTIQLNDRGRVLCTPIMMKAAATTISPKMVFALRKMVKQYDVIHVHHPDPMACLALYLSGFKGKVVLHWHSDILKQRWLLKLYMPLQNWLVNRADVVVGTSPVYLAESPYLQRVQHKTKCVPIGIDSIEVNEIGAEEIRKRYPGKKIVFSMGRLIGYKGYQYLVEAARYLSDDFVVLIGGTGHLMEDLQSKIDQWGLQDKVKLLGFVRDEDVAAYYTACDLFCLPSIMKTEAFGIVQIEAMSCGKPVVTTKIPESGVSWVNQHGVSGLNVEPRDAKALANAIEKVTENAEDYKKYCEGARRHFDEMFTKPKMIQTCVDLYKKLLEA